LAVTQSPTTLRRLLRMVLQPSPYNARYGARCALAFAIAFVVHPLATSIQHLQMIVTFLWIVCVLAQAILKYTRWCYNQVLNGSEPFRWMPVYGICTFCLAGLGRFRRLRRARVNILCRRSASETLLGFKYSPSAWAQLGRNLKDLPGPSPLPVARSKLRNYVNYVI